MGGDPALYLHLYQSIRGGVLLLPEDGGGWGLLLWLPVVGRADLAGSFPDLCSFCLLSPFPGTLSSSAGPPVPVHPLDLPGLHTVPPALAVCLSISPLDVYLSPTESSPYTSARLSSCHEKKCSLVWQGGYDPFIYRTFTGRGGSGLPPPPPYARGEQEWEQGPHPPGGTWKSQIPFLLICGLRTG